MSKTCTPTCEPNSGSNAAQYWLNARNVAARLGVAPSTLNTWLKDDSARAEEQQLFKFHRWIGHRRKWSETSFQLLESAVHKQSENGVLSGARAGTRTANSPTDPDAEDALAEVLCSRQRPRTY